MSRTNAYIALTPEATHVPPPEFDGPASLKGRISVAFAKPLDILRANTGLLLILASQVFFSLMNVAVKTLHSIDPPVPALEVRPSFFAQCFA